jgi:hypothetical protein
MEPNELYLVVLPLIHISVSPTLGFGMTEQTLTLMPSKEFATQFFPDEVDGYIATFENRAKQYLTGGHVTGYKVEKLPTDDGRFVVKVIQNVE